MATATPALSQFALDALAGLTASPKSMPPRYFYDALGSSLFEAITELPYYGVTRADERILQEHSRAIANAFGPLQSIAELGSGSGRKTRHVLSAFPSKLLYTPIDVSETALQMCARELADVADVQPICADWIAGLSRVPRSGRLLLLFLGSSVGNIDRKSLPGFFEEMRSHLRCGDGFLLGADLVKDIQMMIDAYDDPVGVTGAFNLNLLERMNRELDANFDLRSFRHEARWNESTRAIEMHLVSTRRQLVTIFGSEILFRCGESIWTESSHKFTLPELRAYAKNSGFSVAGEWTDTEWPFVETLWIAD